MIHTISRHGYRSRGHGVVTLDCTDEFWRSAASGTTALLRHIRRTVAADVGRGQSWHAVFDCLRIQGPQIWANLDQAARSRLVRHLRALWDVHRFRIAPQVQSAIDELTERGQIIHQAARLIGAVEVLSGIAVTLRPRGSTAKQTLEFDRVVVTTGPAHGSILRTNAMLAAMERAGLVAPDPLGLGLLVTEGCHAVGADGAITANLFVAGPLARGHIGELMGLPEVTSHAQRVATVIAERLASLSGCLHASPTAERVPGARASRSDRA